MSRLDVVIPYFEGERFIEGALTSLANARGSTDLRVVVVDDGSSEASRTQLERTLARCELPWILVTHDHNLGIGATRQRGLEEVETEVVGFLDQDDRWRPTLIDRLLGLMDEADHASGMIEMRLAEGALRPGWCRAEWLEHPLPGTVTGAGLFRTEVLHQLGGFSDAYRFGGDDVDLFARLRRAGAACREIDEVVLTRLVHDSNASGKADLQQDLLAGVRAHLGSR